eukprot:2817239-Rhodomonas_salina.2
MEERVPAQASRPADASTIESTPVQDGEQEMRVTKRKRGEKRDGTNSQHAVEDSDETKTKDDVAKTGPRE